MKIQRKLAGFSACALVLSSLTVPVAHAAEVNFKDIDSHWAKSSIERWAGYEVVNGMGNNQFKPEDTMTRAQMAQILSKTLGLTATATTNPFTDVKDSDWFKDAILKCNAAGIMNGTSATTAKPDAPISRQDAVTMMSRALGIEADGDSTTFDDNGSIGNWAIGFVNAMAKRGIVNGRSEGMFAPKGDIKRGEIATILDRAITTYVNTPNTEVTASAKGITLIAASGVTVKGEAEDILVAPAAAGTTKLDSVKVSGAVTMQAANGTLVLGGTTTAAKLNIPALATGAKVTIEKDATVAAVSSSADNVAIDGNGTITAMTVESGKGVTVAGSVKVGKITNNSQDSMKHGNNIIAGVGATKPSTGSSGSGSGKHESGYTPPIKTEISEVASTQDFVAAVKKDGSAKADDALKSLGDMTIVYDGTEAMTLDLNQATAGNVVVRAANASSITIEGTDKVSKITSLTINAPGATVYNNVATDTVNIEAVDDTNSYHPKKKHNTINLKGRGRIDAREAKEPVDNIVVTGKNAGKGITILGNVSSVEVKSPAEILLDAISTALKLIGSNKNANITMTNTSSVTVSGSVGSLETDATTVMLSNASVSTFTLTTSDTTVTMTSSVVQTATVAAGTTITTTANDTTSNVGTLTARGDVTVGAKVDMLKPSAGSTVTVNSEVKSITTSASITLAGNGNVYSIDSDAANVQITKGDGDVKVENATQLVPHGETSTNATIGFSGFNDAPTPTTKFQAPDASELGYTLNSAWGGNSSLIGVTSGQAYHSADDSDSGNIITNDKVEVKDAGKGGTYFVYVPANATANITKSDDVRVVIPAQMGVTSATISGSAIIGQTLTAAANPDADDTDISDMKYEWSNGKEGATLKLEEDDAGKTITVTIRNYGGGEGATAISKETAVVTADMTDYNVALKNANAALASVLVAKEAGDVPSGAKFVTQEVKDALDKAIVDAANTIATPNTANVTTATDALNTALEDFNKEIGTGTAPSADTAKAMIAEQVATAEKLLSDNTLSTDGNGLDVSYDANKKWYSSDDSAPLTIAINAANTAANGDNVSTMVSALNDLKDAMATFSAKLKDITPLDTTELQAAIDTAEATKAAITANDDATQVPIGTTFVTLDVQNKYATAIAAAKDALTSNTQKAINTALATLNEATTTFVKAQQPGTALKVTNYTVTCDEVDNVTLSADKTSATKGTTITITAAPANGYQVDSVTATTESGADVTVSAGADANTWTFKMPEENVTVSATVSAVAATTYTVSAAADLANVTLTFTANNAAVPTAGVEEGTEVTITATPEDGYTVTAVTAKDASDADVTVNKSETEENTWTFTMPASNVTVTATATMAETKAITSSVTYTVGDDTTTYTLASDTGIVTLNPTSAGAGTEVEITVDSSKANVKTGEGTYTLASDSVSITLTDTTGTELDGVTATPKTGEDNVWTFTMPDPAVEVKVNVVLKYTKQ